MSTKKIPTNVYAEMTPNPATMKFVADRKLTNDGHQLEFLSPEQAALCSPLAVELFHSPFVKGVFISGSIVSVTKDKSLGWEMIVNQLREYIREWLMDNELAVDPEKVESALAILGESSSSDLEDAPGFAPQDFIKEEDISPSEHDDEIKHLLDEFVKPAVE